MVMSSSNSKYKAAGGACKKMNGGASQKKMNGGASQKKMNGGASKKMTKKSKKSKKPMKANEGYCMMCGKRVVMHDSKDITKETSKRTMKMRVGKCPANHTVYKIVGGG
jgi:hypothetical protein